MVDTSEAVNRVAGDMTLSKVDAGSLVPQQQYSLGQKRRAMIPTMAAVEDQCNLWEESNIGKVPKSTKDNVYEAELPSPAHIHIESSEIAEKPQLARMDARDPSTTTEALVEIIERDGGVIVENIITPELAARIKAELQPYFDTDKVDASGFFPHTTQRATGLLATSDACVELACNKTFIDVANAMISATYTYWNGQEQITVTAKPTISSTVGFRVNPGGRQQDLHRDDADYHTRNCDMPMMVGCVTAITKTTKENGATIVIPGSHKWGEDRCPYDEEAIPAELDIGDALIFLGNTYHAGGGNITKDQARETVGIFLCKAYYRQAENQYLMVPPEKARRLSPQAQRLLGYGICKPSLGFVDYQDPMRVLFGVEDEETVDM